MKMSFPLYDFWKKNYDILCAGSQDLTVGCHYMVTEYHNFFQKRSIFVIQNFKYKLKNDGYVAQLGRVVYFFYTAYGV